MGHSHSSRESLQALGAKRASLNSSKKVKKLFDKYDVNHSDFLEQKQAHAYLNELYDTLNYSQYAKLSRGEVIELWFNHFDTNSDGKFNRQEFQVSMQELFTNSTGPEKKAEEKKAKQKTQQQQQPKKQEMNKIQKQEEPKIEEKKVEEKKEDVSPPQLNRQKSTIFQEPVDRKWDGIESCGLCMMEFEDGEDVIRLTKCIGGHYFHKDCELGKTIGQYIEESKKCPVCATFYGKRIGNQPNGTMSVTTSSSSLPGHSGQGTITINFNFPSGTQGPKHYQPGQPYSSDSRTAYLPNSKEGKEVLALFRQAWDQKIMFTVGYSITRKTHGLIIYNGIHHKTNQSGGPTSHGYPDATYLERVKDELSCKGIVPE